MGIRFDPETWYTENELRARLDWDEKLLARARRDEGRLCRQIGWERWYKGEWLLEWLERVGPAWAQGREYHPANGKAAR